MEFVEAFSDVIISESEQYTMHSKAGTVNLHGEDDELDEIIDELSNQVSNFKRFDEKAPLVKLNSTKINRFYDVRGCEGLDSAIKSCLATKGVLKKELSLQQLFKNYCQVLDEQAFQGQSY